MKTKYSMKRFLVILGFTLSGVMLATGVDAANPESVTVEVEFVDPITITEVSALQFGLLDQNLNLDTIVIAPDNALTDAGGIVLGGPPRSADLTVTATAGQTITIFVDNIVANTGYTLGTFICDYDGGAATACDIGGFTPIAVASATLRVGVTLTGTNLAVPGVFNGSFDVTVSYQ